MFRHTFLAVLFFVTVRVRFRLAAVPRAERRGGEQRNRAADEVVRDGGPRLEDEAARPRHVQPDRRSATASISPATAATTCPAKTRAIPKT